MNLEFSYQGYKKSCECIKALDDMDMKVFKEDLGISQKLTKRVMLELSWVSVYDPVTFSCKPLSHGDYQHPSPSI